jgi:uncharacterized protein YutE (UPF0331/DUF86 family)
MVDQTLILRKLAELESYITQISEFKSLTVRKYQTDWKTQRIVDRTLHLMVEICIDIAGHIISDQKFRIPDSFADGFRILHENGIISDGLIASIVKMAKFRNILVHQYEKVDPQIVMGILRKNVGDFQMFSNEIVIYLKQIENKLPNLS